MCDFEEIIRTVDNTDLWLKFHPMYNEHCFRESIAYLKKKEIDLTGNKRDFLFAIDTAQKRIAMIEQELKTR